MGGTSGGGGCYSLPADMSIANSAGSPPPPLQQVPQHPSVQPQGPPAVPQVVQVSPLVNAVAPTLAGPGNGASVTSEFNPQDLEQLQQNNLPLLRAQLKVLHYMIFRMY